jgi:broad specificity phosphatase PhoE
VTGSFSTSSAGSSAKSVLCIRHGLTEWNALFRWQGRADVALAAEGRKQAQRAGEKLAGLTPAFDVLMCSPLQRARHTAELIGEHLGLPIHAMDERWVERDIGEWSGLTTTEIESKWPGMLDAWRKDGIEQLPGGEREVDMTTRVTEVLEELLQTLNGKRALVVTHGGVLHTFSTAYKLRSRPFDNLEGRWFGWNNGSVVGGDAVTLDKLAVRRNRGTAL